MSLLLCFVLTQAPPASAPPAVPGGAVDEARKIVAAVVRAAEENAARKEGKLRGDALADHYIRRAAAAAQAEKVSPRAFLLALGVAFDHTNLLRSNPLLGRVLAQVESDAERKHRLGVLGDPTLRRRNDWLLHFTIAAALTAQLGPEAAEQMSLAKELLDAQGGSGFSFGDLAADFAGIALAKALLADANAANKQIAYLAESYRGDDFLAANADLAEGISLERFKRTYGTVQDPRFLDKAETIRKRLAQAPGFQSMRKSANGLR